MFFVLITNLNCIPTKQMVTWAHQSVERVEATKNRITASLERAAAQ